MALDGEKGALIRQALIQFGKNIKSDVNRTSPFDKNVNGRIVEVNPDGYTVEIQTRKYPNVKAINAQNLQVNDIVACCIPNNQMSQVYILGKLVGNISVSAGGGGTITDVQVNSVSVVASGVANILADTTVTSGSSHLVTSGAVYNALSGIVVPTSINGMSGGTLTSPLYISGGDATTASKIALSRSQAGQITDESTSTLFGWLSNNATTLTVGSNSYGLNLRGNTTRPQYKGNDLALYSDIPTDYVALTGNQTIAGQKTFTSIPDVNGTNVALSSDLSNFVSGTLNQNISVAGTTKNTYTYDKTAIYSPNGLIMGGTAAAAGLVTRGICGVTTPSTGGACTKDNLYINYDGDNTYRSTRHLVLQAGTAGTHYGNNVYQYCAVRGDAFKNYIDNNVDGTITATASKNAKRDTSGNVNAVGFNLCTVSTSTANAKMQYNSTNESIEFIFN